MATSQMSQVLDQFRRGAVRRDEAGLGDGELLDCFIERRDEAAFEALLRRHGPMVLGVCRRVLRDHHDAEEAFQATFLVLARKAAAVVPRGMVANWLYGVAYRTALKAKTTAAKRRVRERQVTDMPEPEAAPEDLWQELEPLLDQELGRLPDKYRAAIVLCDLEGKTRKEAARQLKVPEGTVSSRLTTARRLLAQRLSRRGFTLAVGSLAGMLSAQAAAAAVPVSLAAPTAKAATLATAGQAAAAGLVSARVAALTEGVLKSMLLTKLRIAVVLVIAVALVGGGSGPAWYGAPAGEPAAPGANPNEAAAPRPEPRRQTKEEAIKKALEKLQGTWVAAPGGTFRGKEASEEDIKTARHRLVISGREFKWYTALQEEPLLKGTFAIDPTTRPATMDMTFERGGETAHAKCIYEVNGDTMKLCYGEPDRPTEFRPTPDSDNKLYVWKLEKP
jgi:RNA polymerase sigma factor (sigma-70 family)